MYVKCRDEEYERFLEPPDCVGSYNNTELRLAQFPPAQKERSDACSSDHWGSHALRHDSPERSHSWLEKMCVLDHKPISGGKKCEVQGLVSLSLARNKAFSTGPTRGKEP